MRRFLSVLLLIGVVFTLCFSIFLVGETEPTWAYTNQPNQILFSGSPAACNGSANRYMALFYAGSTSSSVDSNLNIAATAGTLSTFRVGLDGTPGTSKSYLFSVRLNGVNTSLAVTISGTDTTGVNITNPLVISPGDRLSVEAAPTGTPTARNATWCCNFTAATANESLCSNVSAATAQGATTYWSLNGYAPSGTSESSWYRNICPTPGILKKLYVFTDGAAVGQDYVVTVRKNGVDTSLKVTITGGTAIGSDLGNTISLVAGDALSVKTVYGAGADASIGLVNWGVVFAATNINESVIMCTATTAMNTGSTLYQHLSYSQGGSWSAETSGGVVNSGFVYKSLYVALSVAPGGVASYTLNVRLNGAGTGITVTITGAATTGSDTVNTATTTAGVITAIESVPVGTPAASRASWGLVIMSTSSDVSGVAPGVGDRGESGKSEIITGINFTGATAVSFGLGITVTGFVVDTNTQITATVTIAWDATIGSRDVTVTNLSGTGTLTAGYAVEVPTPVVTLCDPTHGIVNDDITFIITGTGFVDTSVISLGVDITVNDFDVIDYSMITGHATVIAGASLGFRDVSVTTIAETGTLVDGFEVVSGGGLPPMDLLAFSVICLGLMISGYAFKNSMLLFTSGIAWFGFGVYEIAAATGSGDTAHAFGAVGLIMTLVGFVSGTLNLLARRKERKDKEKPKKEFDEEYFDSLKSSRKDYRI